MRRRRPVRALAIFAMASILTTGARGQQARAPVPPAAPLPSAAREAELDRRVREIAASLRCPVCYGLSVEDSPSELARDMKRVIRDMLVAGRTPDEIRAYFVRRYGEWILLEPVPRGFNLVVWLLPIAAVLAGAGVVWLAVRKWTRPAIGDAEARRRAGGAVDGA